MILYHGSNVEFDKVDLLKSKPNKDFGRGFYLSDNQEQALDMAKTKVEQLETGVEGGIGISWYFATRTCSQTRHIIFSS